MTGSGTVGDPYIIGDVTDLQNINNDLDAYYELANDIDASATSGWNGGAGFVPIGSTTSNPFKGSLDGKGHHINSLFINRSSPRQGLFGVIATYGGSGAVVKNLGVMDANVSGTSYTAIMVGHATGGYIHNCIVSGEVNGSFYVGSFSGYCWAKIQDCRSYANVTGSGNYIGGFVGRAPSGTAYIKRSVSYGTITALGSGRYIGGFAGDAVCSITQCCSFGDVYALYALRYVGGFISGYSGLSCTDCFARGSVWIDYASSSVEAGGFAGVINGSATKCYSTGYVSKTGSYIGGFAGKYFAGGCTACFWDVDASAQATSACGTGKSTADMKTQSTFTDAGWDFDTIWVIDAAINDGYPYLGTITYSSGFLWVEGTKLAYTTVIGKKKAIEGTLDGATGQTAGHLWVEGDNLRYIDSSGNERYLTGTLSGATGQTPGHIRIEGSYIRYIDSSGNERYLAGS